MMTVINKNLSLVSLLLLLLLTIFQKVEAQNVGEVVGQAEKEVKPNGGFGVLNCTVYKPADVYVEWAYLNATGGSKVVSKDCGIREENNILSGREKYEIFCKTTGDIALFSLTVNMLSFPDSGWYECRTRVSNQPAPTSSMKVELTVLSPPKIRLSATPLTVEAFLNNTVELPCVAEGVPGPNVTWGRANGKPLSPLRASQNTSKLSDIVTNETLTIVNLTKQDTGIYRCSADNNIRPPDDFYAKISVQYKPTVAPVEPTYGTETGENAQVMLWCKVDGNPRPNMLWYAMSTEQSNQFADGELDINNEFFEQARLLVDDEKFNIEQKVMTVGSLSTMESMFYTLTIISVNPGDMLYYVCKAENDHGIDHTAVQLYRINTLGDSSSFASHTTASISTLLMSWSFVIYFLSL